MDAEFFFKYRISRSALASLVSVAVWAVAFEMMNDGITLTYERARMIKITILRNFTIPTFRHFGLQRLQGCAAMHHLRNGSLKPRTTVEHRYLIAEFNSFTA